MTRKLLLLLFGFVLAVTGAKADNVLYAVLSDANSDGTNETMTLYWGEPTGTEGTDYYVYDGRQIYWNSSFSNFNTAVIDASCSGYTGTTLDYLFYYCLYLNTITGLENLSTANVTSLERMFYRCASLTSLDLSKFNTENVTNMHGMFEECSALTSLDLSSLNTAKVTDMGSMFKYCSSLTSLDLSKFNTANVTDMNAMFGYCSSLTSLDLSSLNTAKVTDMRWMFYGCFVLASVDVRSFNTGNVTDMGNMFYDCHALASLDLSSFNTANVTKMDNMFYACNALTSLDLSGFNTAKVTDMSYMFSSCSSLASLDISKFNTANVTNMNDMFNGCSALASLDLSSFDTGNLTDMGYMFYGCSGLTSLDLSSFNTAKVTYMNWMFHGCSALKTIVVGYGWNTSAVFSGGDMFTGCTSLVGEDGTTYDSSNANDVTYAHTGAGGYLTKAVYKLYAVLSDADGDGTRETMTLRWGMPKGVADTDYYEYDGNLTWFVRNDDGAPRVVIDSCCSYFDGSTLAGLFYGFKKLTSIIGLGNLSTSNVTDMSYMFYGCSALASLDLTPLNTANVTNMTDMFSGCSALTSLDLTPLNTANVTNMTDMFSDCSALTSLDLGQFNTANVTSMRDMFRDCSALTSLDLSQFNTANVTDMYCMFKGCSALKTIFVGDDWSTSAVTTSVNMFFECISLVGEDGTTYDRHNVGAAYAHTGAGGYLTKATATGIGTPLFNNGEKKVFDLGGRRVVAPGKGLYIVNGKKVVSR